MDTLPRWRQRDELPLTAENLRALFDNEIPVVRVKGFVSLADCQSFLRGMEGANVQRFNVPPHPGYIGTAQFLFRWGHQKADYFAAARQAYDDRDYVFRRSWDPIARVNDALAAATGRPVKVAEEPGFGPYYAGIIRLASGGIKRHTDFAPFNAPDYTIASIDAQLGWNLFFETPEGGGSTTIYNRPWKAEVVPGQEPPQSYDLPDSQVAGAETWTYHVAAGDLIFFNTRNPHEVSPGTGAGQRLHIGAFVGRRPDSSMVVWS